MYNYLLTFRSLTYGQRAQRAVQSIGISTALMRTPKILAENGCGYCIKIKEKDLEPALAAMRKIHISPINAYVKNEDGSYEKVMA